MAELIWEGKYRDGRRVEPSRTVLPLRTVEVVEVDGPHPDPLPRGEGEGREGAAPCLWTVERVGEGDGHWRNRLIRGDKALVLPSLLGEFAGKVDLVYIDPPFDTGADFSFRGRVGGGDAGIAGTVERLAYSDSWSGGVDGYLQWFYETVVLLRELLADRGSLYVHLDWHVGHLARAVLDEVFGADNFRNELIWAYGRGGRGAKAVADQFPRIHDVIYWYGKSAGVTYHPPRIERRVPAAAASRAGFRRDGEGRWFKTSPRGDYSDRSVAALESQGRIHRTRSGSIRVKYFLRSEGEQVIEDALLGDTWTDIPDGMHLAEAERTGYETQKPEALLERILRASSEEGNLVLDCLAGSGTTAVVAERLGRRWIAADLGRPALHVTRKRLLSIPNVRPFVLQEVAGAGLEALESGRQPAAREHHGGRPARASHPEDLHEPSDLSVRITREGRSVTLLLAGSDLPLEGASEEMTGADASWDRWVDYWSVDWDNRGEAFHDRWRSYRTRRDRVLRRTAMHSYGQPGRYLVVVKLIDVLGNETTRRVAVEVP